MNNDLMLVPRELLELIEKSWRVPDGCPREVAAEVRDIIGGGLDQLRSLLAAAPAVLAAPVLEDEGYPPCDYCGNTPDYHPWHGSGLLNGTINKHIHACDECRSKLPAHAPVRAVRLPAVDGDELPALDSTILIHLGRSDTWAPHTVVGYYAWGNHAGDDSLHRVFVRVRDADGYLNARLLKNVRRVDAQPAETPQQ